MYRAFNNVFLNRYYIKYMCIHFIYINVYITRIITLIITTSYKRRSSSVLRTFHNIHILKIYMFVQNLYTYCCMLITLCILYLPTVKLLIRTINSVNVNIIQFKVYRYIS